MQEKTLHYDWVDAAKGLGIVFVVLGQKRLPGSDPMKYT